MYLCLNMHEVYVCTFSSLNWHSAFGHFVSGYWCNYRIKFPLISRRVVFLFFQVHDFLLNMFFWVSFAYQDSSMRIPAQQFLSLRALGAPAVVVSLALQGVFRGFKDTKTPVLCLGKCFVSMSVVILTDSNISLDNKYRYHMS